MSLEFLNGQINHCQNCSRLISHVATLSPRKGLSRSDYWNRPVAGFGDNQARVCIVGLAPGAHGANRTGRPFTGDGAGDFMYPLLHKEGFANQPHAEHSNDGLNLTGLYITNAVKCLPPENKPNAREFAACRKFLLRELHCLHQLKVIIALGRGAYSSLLSLFRSLGVLQRMADFPFVHGAYYEIQQGFWLLGCYHTSRYNVQTGRITEIMFRDILRLAKSLANRENG